MLLDRLAVAANLIAVSGFVIGYVDYETDKSDRDIWLIDRGGENLHRLTSNVIEGENFLFLAWTPDGTKILFSKE